MNISHTLICFFLFCEYFSLFSSLQDGNTGLVSAQLTVHSVIEGENVRVECSFPSYKKSSFFCKETCKQEDILIETTDAKDYQRARYSIAHKQDDFLVTITQLTKSDSGKYRCGSTASSSRNSSKLIEIIVVDAKLDGDLSAEKNIDARTGGNIVVECSFTRFGTKRFFCKEECEGDILFETTSDTSTKKGRYSIRHVEGGFVFVSIEQLTQSDSGWYRCGLDRPDSKDPYQRFRLNVTDALTTSPKTTEQSESITATGRGLVKPNNLMWKHNMLLHRRLKTTRVNTPTPRSNLSASARPTAVSTVTLSVLSTLFLRWKLALMSPLCTLLLTTPNNSHSLAEEAGVN
ncbi:polymeric immunoglobulin receptor-like isoform X9 [Trematomus bernacchii]|uniref:polymeric immunoglobulin receptor-like isoform X9 n=1 Tax=Trematomus bernacchii TaxID=40690 RepID=UPI00146D2F68|nr:polymeric immunoglobulin receptor-like isoform X9 [Trematomus bernacchii]